AFKERFVLFAIHAGLWPRVVPLFFAINAAGDDLGMAFGAEHDFIDGSTAIVLAPAGEIDADAARIFIEDCRMIEDVAVILVPARLSATEPKCALRSRVVL